MTQEAMDAPLATSRMMPLRAATTLLTLAGFALLLLLYRDTTFYIANLWRNDGTYGFGLLLIPLSAYLVWDRRQRLAVLQPQPGLSGLAVLAGVCCIWFVASITHIQTVMSVALIMMLAALVWALWGGRFAWAIALPLVYPVLATPAWDPLALVLREPTLFVVSKALRAANVPLLVEAHYITIPSGQFVVEEVCAGLRFFMATLALALAYADMGFYSWRRRIAFVVVALCVSIIFNWVRVFVVVYMGHVTEMQHPWVHDHLSLGWYMFAGMLPLLYVVGRFMEDTPMRGTAAKSVIPETKPGRPVRLVSIAICAALIGCAAPLALKQLDAGTPVAEGSTLTMPRGSGRWTGPHEVRDTWAPVFYGADEEHLVRYDKGSESVFVYVAYYREQSQNKELINVENDIAGGRWVRQRATSKRLDVGGPAGWRVIETGITAGASQNRLAWEWYSIGGRFTTDRRLAKLLDAWDRIGARRGSAVVAVAADYDLQQDVARATLRSFVDVIDPAAGTADNADDKVLGFSDADD